MSASFSVSPRAPGPYQYRPSSPSPPGTPRGSPPGISNPPYHLPPRPPLPPLLLSPPYISASSASASSASASASPPQGYYSGQASGSAFHRTAHAFDNASRSSTAGPGNAYEYSHTRLPQINPGTSHGGYSISQPPSSLPLPSIIPTDSSSTSASTAPSLLAHPVTPQRPILPLPSPRTHGASTQQRKLSSTQLAPSRRPSESNCSTAANSPATALNTPSRSRKGSASNSTEPNLYRPLTSHSRQSSQASIYFTTVSSIISADRRASFDMDCQPVAVPRVTTESVSNTILQPSVISPFPKPIPARNMPTKTLPVATPQKARRVRTGCLTCRERHLKCDEGVPDCVNCRKGARECKRGLRLNFIDIQIRPIPAVPDVTCWKVTFFDESRIIADEYAGGLERYPRAPNVPGPNTSTYVTAYQPQQPDNVPKPENVYIKEDATSRPQTLIPLPQTVVAPLQNIQQSFFAPQPQYPRRNDLHTDLDRGIGGVARELQSYYEIPYERKDMQYDDPGSDASSPSSMVPQGLGGPSSVASFQADVGNSPTSVDAECELGDRGDGDGLYDQLPEGLPTPPSEKIGLLRGNGPGMHFGITGRLEDSSNSRCSSNGGEREYLHSPDEVSYMKIFVEEVGVWMDSLDKDKHFSRIIPYMALKSPMMLNAFLACGAKHKALAKDPSCSDLANQYYNTSTMQLTRSLQNPDRDIVESAVTAVVLSVFETMSESWTDRKVHTIGTSLLMKDCGWDAKSKGIGAACFWLSIRTEVLSCLEFHWPIARDPDTWGLDKEFTNPTADVLEEFSQHDGGSRPGAKKAKPFATVSDVVSAITGGEEEEAWVHRILYIVAKVANFRANVSTCPGPSPHDDQVRRQNRYTEWKRIKSLCDKWNDECPQSMRPFSYFLSADDNTDSSSKPHTLFPNIWLIKQTAIMGRLLYHTAMVLLHQLNPVEKISSRANLNAQHHHAHQICGIVAHTDDPGVASVAIRSLAIAALVLPDIREQDESYALLRKLSKKSGWRTDHIYAELQRVWARDLPDSDAPTTSIALMPSSFLPPPSDLPAAGELPGNFGFCPPTMSPNMASGSGFMSMQQMPLQSMQSMGSLGPLQSMPMQSRRDSLSLASLSPSGGRLPLSAACTGTSYGRPAHLRMHSTASNISNASFVGAAAAGSSSPHPSPMVPITNPLKQADFELPDHPYKAHYKPPNSSAQLDSKGDSPA